MKSKKVFIALLFTALALIGTPRPLFAEDATESTALEITADTLSTPDEDASPSTSSSESPLSTVSGVEITYYEIRNQEDTQTVTAINTNDIIRININIKDTRLETAVAPTTTVNTSSFTTLQSGQSAGDAVLNSNDGAGVYNLTFVCKYTGTGQLFSFDISYPNSAKLPIQAVNIPLNQCVEYVEKIEEPVVPDPENEPVIRGTGFALKSIGYGKDDVYAGQYFDLQAIIMATNGDYAIDNASVSLLLPKEFSVSEGSSVSYIGRIGAGQEASIEFTVYADSAAEQGSYTASLSISGVSSYDGSEVLSTVDISIPLRQPERFEIFNASIPQNIINGDTSGYANLTVVNKGKSIIYNVAVSVKGEGLSLADGNVFLGNIEPGTEGYADFAVKGTVNGSINGQVIVTYETGKGQEETLVYDFTVEVQTRSVDVNATDSALAGLEEPEPAVPTWAWYFGSVLAICAVGFVVWLRKRNKRLQELREQEELAADNEPI